MINDFKGSVSPCGSVSPRPDIMTKEEAEKMFLYVYGKELFNKLEGNYTNNLKTE